EKVIIYKSSTFDTYLLAVAVSYLGAIPAMISYHLSKETMDILSLRLDLPFIIYDDETEQRCKQMEQVSQKRLIHIKELKQIEVEEIYPPDKLEIHDICYFTHTSGTTGTPKLIAHSAYSMGWRTKLHREVLDYIDNK